ncbi:MAG: polyphosphate kinase 2 family protein [Gammaproteobacteria bacterium]|nr:polyphosphate kinase 2 family protein [Gammaproteobacteria bacterium]
MKNSDARGFLVRPGRKLKLARCPTDVPKLYRNEKDAEEQLARQVARTSELQDVLYASDRHSLLLIFQAMDAAGKDGAIKHVLSGVNPLGCQVSSFKQPSAEELDHDFLWRTTLRLPERGRIGIFNRSYYEEVLVVRVHPQYLAAQRLPEGAVEARDFWEGRLRSIRDHEAHLHRNGTRILKFFLHVSHEEQRKRFLDRIDHPDKNWKFNLGDVEERGYWDDYMRAYEQALAATSTQDSPWYVIPADDKKNARLLISQAMNATLESMGLAYPKLDRKRLAELKAARKLLAD